MQFLRIRAVNGAVNCVTLQIDLARATGPSKEVGFGDEAVSTLCKPRLTFLRRPIPEMAAKAVVVVPDWIEGRKSHEPVQILFEEPLVIQGTALTPKTAIRS